MLRPSIRHIRAARRRRAIAWSDRFVLFLTTRATAQGRAGVGLRRDAPAFLGETARSTRLNDERIGPAPPDGGPDLPSSARFQPVSARSNGFSPDIMTPLYALSARVLSILFVDLDHFKVYNDTHGHQAGDDVMRELGGLMTEMIAEPATAARFSS